MSRPLAGDEGFILEEHIRQVQRSERTSFHMPGHKGGAGAPPSGVRLLGTAAYEADLSELSGFDYLHGAESALARAQRRAARVFGADRTWFLVNGATVGNLAAICSVVGDGEEILVQRGSHRSVYAGLAVSGARPIYLPPVRNDRLDGLFGLQLADVEAALTEHPGIRAIHITNPSYYGFVTPVGAVAELARARGIPLLVDEAHGTHLAFCADLPRPALSLGADLAVQSPHKTLGSLTQSSLLHLRGTRVSADRLEANLANLQSSSPSALLLGSLDAAIAEMAARGTRRWHTAVTLARTVRRAIGEIAGLAVLGDEIDDTPGIAGHDPTKIVVDVDALGTTGFAAGRWLRLERGLNPEFADLRRMVFSITLGDTETSAALLVEALRALAASRRHLDRHPRLVSLWPEAMPVAVVTPRRAGQLSARRVALEDAAERAGAEMIVPYPPGVPLLVPGEVIGHEAIGAIRQLKEAGSRIVGPSDPALGTLRVLDTA